MKKFNLLIIIFAAIVFVSSIIIVTAGSSTLKPEIIEENKQQLQLATAMENTNNSTNLTINSTIQLKTIDPDNISDEAIVNIKVQCDEDAICITLSNPEYTGSYYSKPALYGYKNKSNSYDWYFANEYGCTKIDEFSDFIDSSDVVYITNDQLNPEDFTFENNIYYADLEIVNLILSENIDNLMEEAKKNESIDEDLNIEYEIACETYTIEIANNFISSIETSFSISLHDKSLNEYAEAIFTYSIQYSNYGTTEVPSLEEINKIVIQ